MKPKNKLIVSFLALILVAGGVLAFSLSQSSNGAEPATSQAPQGQPIAADNAASNPADIAQATNAVPKVSKYKDGIYTATGSYDSPGGPDSITVTITLKGGIITDTSAVNGANDHTSSRYQNMFIDNYKSQVVGKNIDSINLTYVSGSSLTPEGFNDALSKIKTQASA